MAGLICPVHGVWTVPGDAKPCCELGTVFNKPSEAQVETAKQVARERGWLTEDGWLWERHASK